MKSLIIVVVAVVAIIGGAVLLGGGDDSSDASPSNNFYGQEEGIITVTEYADFECPGCGSFAQVVNQVKEEFKDQVRFEFRHFPLVNIHGNATAAHRAAQAAANQGKFWEMHDVIFVSQTSWNTQSGTTNPGQVFEGYAEQLELDMEQYRNDVSASDTLSTINADIDLGKNNDVASTPTFIIDGEIVDTSEIGTPTLFSEVIQAAIDAKNGTSNEDSTDESEDDSNSSDVQIDRSSDVDATKPEEETATE